MITHSGAARYSPLGDLPLLIRCGRYLFGAFRTPLESQAWAIRSGSRIPEGEPEGSSLLYADTRAYMAQRDLGDLEALFTRQYVSHFFNEAVRCIQSAPKRSRRLGNKATVDGV